MIKSLDPIKYQAQEIFNRVFSSSKNALEVFSDTDYYEIVSGNVTGKTVVHKFGAGSVSTTLVPVTQSGFYRTPTTAVALEFVSDDATDTSDGVGAREITVTGLNSSWEEVTIVKATNGITPVAFGTDLVRLYRWHVSSSGTYATQSSASHAGTLTIREVTGGAIWSTIGVTPFPSGQSQIGAYTIPTGKTGYLIGKLIYTDTGKTADVYFFQRNNADDVTAPFTGIMRLIEREVGVQGGFDHHFTIPKNGFVGPCDVGCMAKVASGTADISVEFEMLLVDN